MNFELQDLSLSQAAALAVDALVVLWYEQQFVQIVKINARRAVLAKKQEEEIKRLIAQQLYDVAEAIHTQGMTVDKLSQGLFEYHETLRRILCR